MEKTIKKRKAYDYAFVLEKSKKYFGGDELSASTWINKYALKDAHGNIYEQTPEDMHKRIASEIARIESKYPNPLSAEEIFSLIDRFRYIVPQGSPMAGIGNDLQKISLSNCFVVGNPEGMGDSYGGIIRIDERIAQLQKRRCGVGTDLSDVRPAGTPVNNAAITATGIVPFMERYSNTTREVAQDGRRGALMLTVSVRHPEAEKFIDAKMDSTKVTGANVSVKIHDDFMESVLAGGIYKQQWPIVGPAKVTSETDANRLWKKIIHNAWRSAEPGVLFWDKIISESPSDCYSKYGFRTVSTNPCGELPLCVGDSCRLLALNLFSYVVNPFTDAAYFDFEKFKKHTFIAQRMMDDIVDLELEKIDAIIEKIKTDPENDSIKFNELTMWEEIREKCQNGRRTGTGVTAEGDMLAALGFRYGTPDATEFAENVHRVLALEVYKSSCILAKERGVFPIYDPALEVDNPFLNRLKTEDSELKYLMSTYGRRNISALTIAPTGTVSMMTQTSSGIECAFLVAYTRRRKINPNTKNARVDFVDDLGDSWEEYYVFHHHFKTWLEVAGYDIDEVSKMKPNELSEIIKNSPYHKAMSNDVDWVEKVRMQGKIQKWIDHSISVTVNLPNDATEDIVNDVYVTAWKSGCKGCTIYRDGSRSGVLIEKKSEKKENRNIQKTTAPKRPKTLPCDIHHMMVEGEQWMVIVGMFGSDPYEVFAFKKTNIKLANKWKEGRLVRIKQGTYNLEIGDNEIIVENINENFETNEQEALTRIISTALRHGADVGFIFQQLMKSEGNIVGFSKAIARTLKKYLKEAIVAKSDCPECGGKDSLVMQDGCFVCKDCGHSKC
jgi:ribonucleoside-diphosphate reductase alpha chain